MTTQTLPNIQYRDAGLILPPGLSEAEWKQVGMSLVRRSSATNWQIGDWLNYGGYGVGHAYNGIALEMGMLPVTLAKIKRVAVTFPLDRRRDKLSWSHHFQVVHLPEPDREKLLDMAERNRWGSYELKINSRPQYAPSEIDSTLAMKAKAEAAKAAEKVVVQDAPPRKPSTRRKAQPAPDVACTPDTGDRLVIPNVSAVYLSKTGNVHLIHPRMTMLVKCESDVEALGGAGVEQRRFRVTIEVEA